MPDAFEYGTYALQSRHIRPSPTLPEHTSTTVPVPTHALKSTYQKAFNLPNSDFKQQTNASAATGVCGSLNGTASSSVLQRTTSPKPPRMRGRQDTLVQSLHQHPEHRTMQSTSQVAFSAPTHDKARFRQDSRAFATESAVAAKRSYEEGSSSGAAKTIERSIVRGAGRTPMR